MSILAPQQLVRFAEGTPPEVKQKILESLGENAVDISAVASCPHQLGMAKTGLGKCALGLYGGFPRAVDCRSCIKAGENTPEFASELFARADKVHPTAVQKISGCCDDARNSV